MSEFITHIKFILLQKPPGFRILICIVDKYSHLVNLYCVSPCIVLSLPLKKICIEYETCIVVLS